jgi:hypothetical protein
MKPKNIAIGIERNSMVIMIENHVPAALITGVYFL